MNQSSSQRFNTLAAGYAASEVHRASPTLEPLHALRWHLLANAKQTLERWLTAVHGRLRRLSPAGSHLLKPVGSGSSPSRVGAPSEPSARPGG